MRIELCLLLCAAFLAACASSVRYTSASPLSKRQRAVVEIAASLVGTPYCRGTRQRDCFDCSGFVQTVFQRVGTILPRTTRQQFAVGKTVSPEELQPGDLVFFRFAATETVSHVGIYAGEGALYHASESRGVVLEQLWGTYLERSLVACRRVWEK